MLEHLSEVIVVDDRSTDSTPGITRRHPGVRLVAGDGRGPGAARNLGWRVATTPLIWFVDADCVVRPDALELLLPHLADPGVGGVGGSYDNLFPDSLVATLIHEEIVLRHRRMPDRVDFLATFNVLYRREALEAVGGFDPRFRKAQDAELAYRVRAAGYELAFDPRSKVGHHHPTRLAPYLRTQGAQGFWRVRLYREHPTRTGGDSYSSTLDHVQPPLAVASLAGLLALAVPGWRWVALIGPMLLALAQLPIAAGIVAATGRPGLLAFIPFSFVRAFARGVGMVLAIPGALRPRGAAP